MAARRRFDQVLFIVDAADGTAFGFDGGASLRRAARAYSASLNDGPQKAWVIGDVRAPARCQTAKAAPIAPPASPAADCR